MLTENIIKQQVADIIRYTEIIERLKAKQKNYIDVAGEKSNVIEKQIKQCYAKRYAAENKLYKWNR